MRGLVKNGVSQSPGIKVSFFVCVLSFDTGSFDNIDGLGTVVGLPVDQSLGQETKKAQDFFCVISRKHARAPNIKPNTIY